MNYLRLVSLYLLCLDLDLDICLDLDLDICLGLFCLALELLPFFLLFFHISF